MQKQLQDIFLFVLVKLLIFPLAIPEAVYHNLTGAVTSV